MSIDQETRDCKPRRVSWYGELELAAPLATTRARGFKKGRGKQFLKGGKRRGKRRGRRRGRRESGGQRFSRQSLCGVEACGAGLGPASTPGTLNWGSVQM